MAAVQYVPVLRRSISGAQNITPVLASCSLLVASFLPWLTDPLGKAYAAWQLPLYAGWGINSISYGWLCLGCGACILLVARVGWRPFSGCGTSGAVRCLCLVPVVLFLSLCFDPSSLILLTHHELQFLWIQQHFGYQATIQLFPFNPLTMRTSTFIERLQLLLNQASAGPPALCVCAGLLPGYRLSQVAPAHPTGNSRWHHLLCGICLCMLLAMLHAPTGMLCEYAAKAALATGNYTGALNLLDAARMFTPELEQVDDYHRERGQAQYFLAPAQQTLDSQVYLATVYREQGDYLEAYQQLLGVWRAAPTVSWVIDEMDVTLEDLTESLRPLRGISTKRVASDDTALPWLQILIKVDASNVYGPYMAGRIQYDLHSYAACIDYMSLVIQKSADSAIQSSAYTYSALCEEGLRRYADARQLLFRAVSLDPNYHNNTAREELSGLH